MVLPFLSVPNPPPEPPPILVRPATPADAAGIARIHVASWQSAYAGLLPAAEIARHTVPGRLERWTEVLGKPAAAGGLAVQLAERGGTIVGFGAAGRQRSPALVSAGFPGEVWALYVLPGEQRQGVGRALMHRLADDLEAEGLCGVALWVLDGNRAGTAFYESIGGTIVGDRFDRAGEDVVREIAYGWRHLNRLRDATL